jgi:hypothetical protein
LNVKVILERLQTELRPAAGTTIGSGMRHDGAGLIADVFN